MFINFSFLLGSLIAISLGYAWYIFYQLTPQKVRLHMNAIVHSTDLAGVDHFKLITSKLSQQNKSLVDLT